MALGQYDNCLDDFTAQFVRAANGSSLKYSGVEEFPRELLPPDQARVVAVIEPLHCTTMG